MEILVTGASGYVGSALMENLSRDHSVIGTKHTQSDLPLASLDITDEQEVERFISLTLPEVVVHAAGMTGRTESDPNLGWKVNVDGTGNIVRAASRIGSKVVFLSSAAVFNGQVGIISESDRVSSVGEYGRTKIMAEDIVRNSGLANLILRPSLVLGTAPYGQEKTFTGWLASYMQDQEPNAAEMNGSWHFAPTWTRDLASSIRWWIDNGSASDTLHVCTSEVTTKFDFARRLRLLIRGDEGLLTSIDTPGFSDNILSNQKALNLGIALHSLDQVISGVAHEIASAI